MRLKRNPKKPNVSAPPRTVVDIVPIIAYVPVHGLGDSPYGGFSKTAQVGGRGFVLGSRFVRTRWKGYAGCGFVGLPEAVWYGCVERGTQDAASPGRWKPFCADPLQLVRRIRLPRAAGDRLVRTPPNASAADGLNEDHLHPLHILSSIPSPQRHALPIKKQRKHPRSTKT